MKRVAWTIGLVLGVGIVVGQVTPWVPSGPAPIINTLDNTLPDGGSVGAIETGAAHPTDPDILYVGPVNGGIWKTTNATSPAPIWVSLGDDLSSPSVSAIEFDPTDGTFQTLVAGQGATSSFFTIAGKLGGLLRTIDGGATWTEITDPLLADKSISAVIARGVVLVASAGEFRPDGGLFRSIDLGANWTSLGVPEGLPSADLKGFDIAGDPTNLTRLYAGVEDEVAGAGGIYRSDDTGATWVNISSGNASLTSALADSLDSNRNGIELAVNAAGRLYVVVIRGFSGQPEYIGYTDDPASATPTWVQMDLPLVPDGPNPLPIADASNATPILISMSSGPIADATNATPIVITSTGHGRSTGDTVFIENVTGNDAANGYSDITVLDSDTFELNSSAGTGAYISGGTWGLYHFLFEDSSTQQVQISGVTGNTAANGEFFISGLYPTQFELYDYYLQPVSGNGAYTGDGTFQIVTGVNPSSGRSGQGSLHCSMVADGTTVYVGGDTQRFPFGAPNSLGALNFDGRLFRGDTTVGPTGGAPSPQWEHLTHSDAVPSIPGGGTANSTASHADSRQMIFDANGDLIEVDDGGVFRRTSPGDNTGDWFSMNSNLQITEFHDIAYDSNSNIIFGGTQDNGTIGQQTTGSSTWVQIQGGDGGDAVVETTSSPGFSVRYTSSQYLGNFTQRTFDAANNEVLTIFPDLQITDGSSGSTWFYGPVEVNAIDATRLVLGLTSNVAESFDQGDTLSSVDFGGGLRANGNLRRRTMAYGGVRNAIPDADLLYVGSRSQVYARLSSGVAPTPTSGAFPGDGIQALRPDPDNWDRLAVVDVADRFDATASSRVWLTEDTGATWTEITGDLPTAELMTIEYLPGTVDRIVVAGQAGVWTTPVTSPGTWTEMSDGLPTAIVQELYYDRTDDVMVAGTLGRGAYLMTKVTCNDGTDDPDGDLVCDPDDNCPNDVNPGQEDSDEDGAGEVCDGCPTDPNKTDPEFCGCNVGETDTDGDTVPDCVDPCPADNPDDTDSDGVCDSLDPCPLDNPDDTDLDGTCDSDDGCPTDPDKIAPGICGCNETDTDETFVRFLGEFGSGSQEVAFPRDLAVDELNRVWVADTENDRLQVFDEADNWLFSLDVAGSGPGEFSFPEGIAADGAGKIYVSDSGNDRVQVLDIFGNFLYEFGSSGILDGEFRGPFGIDVDENGRILVSDRSNDRIQVFDNAGLHLFSFGVSGSADGEFDFPIGVAWDALFDRILVVDASNDRIQGFDANGVWLWSFGSFGTAPGEFTFPFGLHADGSDLYVTDTFNHRIQFLLNTAGSPTFVSEQGVLGLELGEYQAVGGLDRNPATGDLIVADINNSRIQVLAAPIRAFGGPQPGQLLEPENVTVDGTGGVYVANTFRGRVEVYDATGSYLFGMGGLGTAAGELQGPVGLTIDGTGRLFVAERSNHRVSVFDASGVFQFSFDSSGSAAGPLIAPQGIAFDPVTSEIHVVDAGNHRVQVFDTSGVFVYEYGGFGSGPGQLRDPRYIASDGSGAFWIADSGNDRLQSFLGGTAGVAIGSTGSGPGQFNLPFGVAIHPATGELYASDGTDNRVQVLNPIDVFLREFGSFGTGAGEFDFAKGIAITSTTTVYVADYYNNRVQVWEPGLQDADSDGSANCAESCPDDPAKTDPGACGCGNPDTDTDLDTTPDCLDECPLDPIKTAEGVCGCGVSDGDTDGDTVPDCIDPCPLDNPDDTDLDGTCDTLDGCPVDANKTDPGICGCNEPDSGREFVAEVGAYGDGAGETVYGRDVAVDSLGRSFVTDTNNNSVDVFNSSGLFLFSFGTTGSLAGELIFPEGIAADGLGRIYVADGGNHRVQVFDTAGVFEFEFGGFGVLDGEFDTPVGVAINAVGQIVVADSNNHRVQVFDNAGNWLFSRGSLGVSLGEFDRPWGIGIDPATGNIWVTELNNSRVQVLNSGGTAQFTFGVLGTAPGEFNYPTASVFDGSGNVFIADAFNHRIQRFDTAGTFQSEFGVRGNDDADFNAPVGMAMDSAGNLHVADVNNSRYQVVDTAGAFVRRFGGPQPGQLINPQDVTVDSAERVVVADTGLSRIQVFDGLGQFLFQFAEPGTGPGQVDEPGGVATDGANRVYVSDRFNHRVQVFDSGGGYLFEFGSNGTGPGEFRSPVGIALNDAETSLFVADLENHRVQAFDPMTGAFQFESGGFGSGPGQFDSPHDLDADASRIYVTEEGNDRVQVLDQVTGTFVLEFGTTGSGPGQFDFARGVSVDRVTGDIFVSDANLNRVSIFDSTGVFQSEFGSFGSGDGEFDGPAGLAPGSLWIADRNNNRIQLWDDRGLDRDGDGSGNCVDCMPLDEVIFPGADEVCDGKDNDCDGPIDEDPVDDVPVQDQVYDPTAMVDHNTGPFATFDKAQTFTVGIEGQLVQVDALIRRNFTGATDSLIMDVRETSGGVPIEDDATTLASVPFSAASVSETLGFYSFDISSFGVQVQAGDELAIVLREDNGDVGVGIVWFGQCPGPYAGGKEFSRFPPGIPTWAPPNCPLGGTGDLGFRTVIEPSNKAPGRIDSSTDMILLDKILPQITIQCPASCSSAAHFYGVYEGALTSINEGVYDHAQVSCDLTCPMSFPFIPTPASSYYLVVPHNCIAEGSYSTDSIGNERPQPVNVGDRCVDIQDLTACP